jgi:tRNA (guanine-N7-)-methyltransferase
MVFGRDGPLIIEIGFGNGQFLADLGNKQPESNIIGLEISAPSIRNASRLLARRRLKNIRIIDAEAEMALQALFLPGMIQNIYINFPDPWPKEKHQGRRLIDEEFLNLVASRLLPGGELDIATDHKDYAFWILGHLSRSEYFSSKIKNGFVNDDPGRKQTKYDIKARIQNVAPFYFKWRRNDERAAQEFPVPKVLDMPHAILTIPVEFDQIEQRLQPHQLMVNQCLIRIHEIFRSTETPTLLIDTYIKEAAIGQRVMIAVNQRKTGEIKAYLHETGFPRSTMGIHQALWVVVVEILKMHPDAQLDRHNLASSAFEE